MHPLHMKTITIIPRLRKLVARAFWRRRCSSNATRHNWNLRQTTRRSTIVTRRWSQPLPSRLCRIWNQARSARTWKSRRFTRKMAIRAQSWCPSCSNWRAGLAQKRAKRVPHRPPPCTSSFAPSIRPTATWIRAHSAWTTDGTRASKASSRSNRAR